MLLMPGGSPRSNAIVARMLRRQRRLDVSGADHLNAVTHQVITDEELAFVAGHHDQFDRTEQKLSARLEHLISRGNISVGLR